MDAWQASQYDQFQAQRQQAGLDLLNAIPNQLFEQVTDVGCGTGLLTIHLHRRWPEAEITAFDSSESMLQKAAQRFPDQLWQHHTLETWLQQPSTTDLIFCNAMLHWCPDHEQLLPQLLNKLNPGGYLAVQMPQNDAAPYQQILRTIIDEHHWSADLSQVGRYNGCLSPEKYIEVLSSLGTNVRVWQTTDHQILTGDAPILAWLKGAALRPLITHLSTAELEIFEAAFQRRIESAYPRNSRGQTIFPFQRLFFLVQAKG